MTDNNPAQAAQTAPAAGLRLAAPRSLYFAVFTISGFSGLIYQSIWSHYLKLFLGHAAYAQSLVLIIFMGGMAVGSWVASRYSARLRIPILAYAVVEAIVGVVALVFHDMFAGLIEVFHSTVLPGMGSPFLGITSKWLAASLLILPQSILLGTTFPLMSAGIIRRFPDAPGGSIAMLYFTNSIGAAVGVLASGFVMIRAFGLPGTIMTAGLLNIALALVVWMLVKLDPEPETEPLVEPERTSAGDTLTRLFLVAAFITGMASFIYEISWIRMLSLVLGATTHSFELMLSAFITGLAFGGLWIKRRIDRVDDPIRFSGYVQLIMGAFALLTIPVYVMTFDWMTWLREALQATEAGYSGYKLASHAFALAVMLPTTFMAGMTLPLFTYVLLRKGSGESSIGRIYAANTVGAIAGVLFAVHIGLPMLGLKNLIVFGALLDIALGAFLLMRFVNIEWRSPRFAVAGVLVALVMVTTIAGPAIDKRLLASGVYRYKHTDVATEDDFRFYKDGKTASVTFRVTPDGLGVLATNGKPDASIQLDSDGGASLDEMTMMLAGAIPLAYAPHAKRIANIGMGSGQTVHTVLADPHVELIDTVEIEVEMVNASKNYGDSVRRVFEDPRSNIHIEDAKTFFSLNNATYDVIIAEPSNPWVSGVASLFSEEFYGTVRDYLENDGLFVQWIQSYEFTDELAISILKALKQHFDDFDIYVSSGTDILIIAKKEGQLGKPQWDRILTGELGKLLNRVDIYTPSDLVIRQSASRPVLEPFLVDVPVLANSDYFPYVDLNAGKALFLDTRAEMFMEMTTAPLPVLEMLNRTSITFADIAPEAARSSRRLDLVGKAHWVHEKITQTKLVDPPSTETSIDAPVLYLADWLSASQQNCLAEANPDRWAASVFDLMSFTLPNLDPARGEALIDEATTAACGVATETDARRWLQLYRDIARRDGGSMYRSAMTILRNSSALEDFRADYLINAAMLGAISTGRLEDAYGVWDAWGKAHYANTEMAAHTKLMLSISARYEDLPSGQAAAGH
ncbi:MAG: hypothetical protein QNJ00_08745 [Woeseiaceae bacterium]|nr:hypothetical protein [Woeseiaceae bacterium]